MDVTSKRCSRCKCTLPKSNFHKSKGEFDGLVYQCKDCVSYRSAERYKRYGRQICEQQRASYRARLEECRQRQRIYSKKWRDANPEKVKITRKRYYLSNLEKCRERGRLSSIERRHLPDYDRQRDNEIKRQWALRNPDRVKKSALKHRQRYPERIRMTMNNNKSHRRRAPGDVTGEQWKSILEFYHQSCAICKIPSNIKPLTVDHYVPISKGGNNRWDNVWPTCMDCNNRKRAQILPEEKPPHVEALEPEIRRLEFKLVS